MYKYSHKHGLAMAGEREREREAIKESKCVYACEPQCNIITDCIPIHVLITSSLFSIVTDHGASE